jgi:hypothetical protein
MKRIKFVLLTATAVGLSLSSPAQAGVNYIENMQQYQADKKAAPAPMPTEQGGQFWHRSKYLREQTPQMGTTVDTTNRPGQKYDRPDWAPK